MFTFWVSIWSKCLRLSEQHSSSLGWEAGWCDLGGPESTQQKNKNHCLDAVASTCAEKEQQSFKDLRTDQAQAVTLPGQEAIHVFPLRAQLGWTHSSDEVNED